MKFNFKKFLVCRFLAALGDQFMMFTVPLVILKTTGSVAYSGLAFAIEWLPRLLFFPVSGNIADRVNVQKLYQWADGLRFAFVVLASVLLLAFPSASFVVLSIAMAALAVLNSLAFLGMEATFPRQVSASELPKVQSILQGIDQTSQIMGPALAASLTALLPIQTLLFIGAGFFGMSAINALSLPSIPLLVERKKFELRLIVESYTQSWNILRQRPILFQLSLMTWIVNLMFGTILVLAPAITVQTFMQPEKSFGILQTAGSIFGISVFFIIPKLCRVLGLPKVGFLAFVIISLGALISALGSNFIIFAIGAALLLGSDGIFNVYIRSLRAQIIPKADLGKTTGLIILINNCSLPLVGIAVSALAQRLSHQAILLLITVTAISLGVVAIVVGRALFKYPTILPSLSEEDFKNHHKVRTTA